MITDTQQIQKLVNSCPLGSVGLLKRVPELTKNRPLVPKEAKVCSIIDLETTGLDYKADKITEIGIVSFFYSRDKIIGAASTYQAFNDPGVEISAKITALTGITNELVRGHTLNLEDISDIVEKSDLVICHNAAFDRKFLEQVLPICRDKPFGCTKNDIDWQARGYGSNKLDYLNWKLGYFYDAHRAINDCWATLNLLRQEEGAWEELLANSNESYEVYAVGVAYDYKDKLRMAGYKWNDGTNSKPKAWWATAKNEQELNALKDWLKSNVYVNAKVVTIPANKKYSSVV